ncbi:hypothetical protein A3I94_02195 [Candidatus Giovannonibacteria bacterium RIFCSPLOWO2_02_FULL_43_54]|nr:MAG: hypothetical protein A3I94_02195 [Candidatus Giovannonibacteria bacterium RIFCSPLOWO2_02_FULL_43_54]OGF96759.1 MAG: hypothetical protein A3H08_01085 [Candidatus Giovannonibacteria bacterium RIFCSPLOWO2_12_FULL_44_32]
MASLIRVLFRVLVVATTKRARTSNKLSQIVKTGSIWRQWYKALARGQSLATGAKTGQPAWVEWVSALTFGRNSAIMVMLVGLRSISWFPS